MVRVNSCFRRKDDDAPRGGKENVYDKQQPEATNILERFSRLR